MVWIKSWLGWPCHYSTEFTVSEIQVYVLRFSFSFSYLGTAANAVAFQAYLLEGVSRWNAERAAAAVQDHADCSHGLYTFDISLQHHLNRLHMSLRNEALLPKFTPPGVYTGERIGVEYLRSQSDVLATKDLEKEIDEAFEDFLGEPEDIQSQDIQDITLALPEESSESDSGTEEVGETHCNV